MPAVIPLPLLDTFLCGQMQLSNLPTETKRWASELVLMDALALYVRADGLCVLADG
eukprot:CAMPEP_0175954246 /NCGR_PEP_ID=MMETSP0108-20121206/31808_1 /TAXON_ID=195067 ORGANISM="Goniomonas pacifica, Strain CCMP1869" /NCGR_SAMPLE_ID=MMETSP0108 /ASSEMBLY_ACC=CAM_ASM_000204 /LENGTH=55 /DNA_ID=CAMNT_0017280913 /DNA_START=168 /DNA_END=335 /DNA_ORIENTATION=+